LVEQSGFRAFMDDVVDLMELAIDDRDEPTDIRAVALSGPEDEAERGARVASKILLLVRLS